MKKHGQLNIDNINIIYTIHMNIISTIIHNVGMKIKKDIKDKEDTRLPCMSIFWAAS